MKRFIKGLSMRSKGLHYRLVISFALMSLIPLLVSVYFFWNYVLRKHEEVLDFSRALNPSLLILFSFILAVLGFYLLGRILTSISSLTREAKLIAGGDFSRRVKVEDEDEISDLGSSLNDLCSEVEKDISKMREKIMGLERQDNLTDLYNERYIKERLEEEVKKAILYQRPCSFALLNINGFREWVDKQGKGRGEEVLKSVADALKENVEEVNKVGRFKEALFAIIFVEKNKGEADRIIQDLKKILSEGLQEGLAINYGLSANPIDGVKAEELILKARGGLILKDRPSYPLNEGS